MSTALAWSCLAFRPICTGAPTFLVSWLCMCTSHVLSAQYLTTDSYQCELQLPVGAGLTALHSSGHMLSPLFQSPQRGTDRVPAARTTAQPPRGAVPAGIPALVLCLPQCRPMITTRTSGARSRLMGSTASLLSWIGLILGNGSSLDTVAFI